MTKITGKGKALWLVFAVVFASTLATTDFSVAKKVASDKPQFVGTVEKKIFFAEPNTARNWTDARAYCKKNMMRLASFTTSAQKNWLREARNATTLRGLYWTAGRDVSTRSQYVWDHDRKIQSPAALPSASNKGIKTCLLYGTRRKFWPEPCYVEHQTLCEYVA